MSDNLPPGVTGGEREIAGDAAFERLCDWLLDMELTCNLTSRDMVEIVRDGFIYQQRQIQNDLDRIMLNRKDSGTMLSLGDIQQMATLCKKLVALHKAIREYEKLDKEVV